MDSDGNIGVPFRSINVIENLRRAGKISDEAALAAYDFANSFYRAGLVGIKAAPLERVGAGREYVTETKISAMQEIWGARVSLGVGSMEDLAAWHVLGLWKNMAEWVIVAKLSRRLAEKTIVRAIRTLADYYGYSNTAR